MRPRRDQDAELANLGRFAQHSDLKPAPDMVIVAPPLELMLKRGILSHNAMLFPCEILTKIFSYVLESSRYPITDLCNLAQVCETWRQIILQTSNLWSRMDFNPISVTDKNIHSLKKILNQLNPLIVESIDEVVVSGFLKCKNVDAVEYVGNILSSPNITKITIRNIRHNSCPLAFIHAIIKNRRLECLNLTESRSLFNNQKWLVEFLTEHGLRLHTLNLAMSLTMISAQLFRAISYDCCPNLRVLDISTCDALATHSFNAVQFSKTMPNLEILRAGNVSFKRVHSRPTDIGLMNLEELSIPIGRRDTDRDDLLFMTLAYGSDKMKTLDLRGSSLTAPVLLDMPSNGVRELHMDDLCPLSRPQYHSVIRKWASSLEVLSLVKINCTDTIQSCLQALVGPSGKIRLRDLDLTASDVAAKDLCEFIERANQLQSIDLSSCRSLPRGCKGVYKASASRARDVYSIRQLKLKLSK